MERRVLGKTGMNVSVLGFGGAEIGFEGAEQATVEKLLSAAIDQGLNAIDTAECYVNSEEMIGKAVANRRSDFYLFTKCGHGATYNDEAWSAKDIEKSIDRSLKRLQTDYVDLLQLHSCSSEILKKGEVVEALQAAQKAGKTRFIGYSGDGEDALLAINMNVFDTLQTSVSIFDQQCIDMTLPLAQEKNMGVIAKRPIGNAVWRHSSKPANEYVHEYWDRLQKLKFDFINVDASKTSEIALRFTLSAPAVTTMIVGTTNPDRWKDNADLIAAGKLSEAELTAIRERWYEVADQGWVGQV